MVLRSRVNRKDTEMRIVDFEPRANVIDYAIGDVHGYLEHMVVALEWCAEDARSRGCEGRVHLLGDYVDRGPDSRGVIEHLMAGSPDRHMTWHPLKGNHDFVFASTCRDPRYALAAQWWEHGGQQTLMSYGWNVAEDGYPGDIARWVPRAHSDFLMSLPVGHTLGAVVFVHAGIRPEVALVDQTDRDLMWIRTEFLNAQDLGYRVVHGHTPDTKNPVVTPDRVSLDAGCFMSGNLALAAFDHGAPHPRLHVVSSAIRSPAPADDADFDLPSPR
jgi:serine/threonine protein phosphatase 1